MNRYGLIIVTLLTLPLTGITLSYAGWFSPRTARAEYRVAGAEDFASPAARNWRSCQPNHWRTCLIRQ